MEIVRDNGDLERELWRFCILKDYQDKISLELKYYSKMSRLSKRHKFKDSQRWDSFDQRYYRSPISRKDVPEPEDVINEAISSVQVIYKPLDKERK